MCGNVETYSRAGKATNGNMATNTHSGYVVLIAFPLQQWLHERAGVLRYSIMPVLLCYSRTLFQLHMLFIPRKIVGCFVCV
jgi:hypothetical protein